MLTLKLLSVCTLLIIGLANQAHAGNEAHGGTGIACNSPDGKSVELLDYFEASRTTNLMMDLGPKGGQYLEHVFYVLDRLALVDPNFAEYLRTRALNFWAQVKFLSSEEMKRIFDSNEPITAPEGCSKDQFAVQIFNLKPRQARYLVNRDLWYVADAKTQAGLVLHEIIYGAAVEFFGHKDSDNARYFNAQISSSQFSSMTKESYLKVLKASEFTCPSNVKCPFGITN